MLIHYFKELLKDRKLMRACVKVAVPIMLQQLIGVSVNLVDNLMVAELGDAAISAVATSNKYYNIVVMCINGVIGSCVIFLSQFNGAHNIEKMKETFRFAIVSSYVFVIVSFLAVILFPSQLIAFIMNDPEVVELGTRYLRLAAFSYLPLGLSMSISGSMRSVGDSKTPMYLSIISVATNCILDYALIFGKLGFPELGIEGAAIATVIARVVEMFAFLIAVKVGDYDFKTDAKSLFTFSGDLAKNILVKGAPLVINEALWQFGMTFLFKCYSSRGQLVNTAYAIAYTVADLFFIIFSGMAISSTVLIGTPLGANKLDEARENGYKLIVFSVLLAALFGVGLYASELLLPLIYRSASSDAVSLAQGFLKCLGLCLWIFMFNTQCYFTLRAGGDTKATLFMDSGYMWLVNIPVVFFLSYFTQMDVLVVYCIGQLTDLVKGFISFAMVRKEKWVRNLAVENK